jgi:hypothetical protein
VHRDAAWGLTSNTPVFATTSSTAAAAKLELYEHGWRYSQEDTIVNNDLCCLQRKAALDAEMTAT